MTWFERLIIAFGFAVMIGLFVLAICWLTVIPMMENHRKCGTIFLCKHPAPPSPDAQALRTLPDHYNMAKEDIALLQRAADFMEKE